MSNRHTPSISDSTYAPSDDVIHNGEAWATAPSEDPWDPAILALDGGGIRGYSTLLVLKALMHEIAVIEKKLDEDAKQGHESPSVLATPPGKDVAVVDPITSPMERLLSPTRTSSPRSTPSVGRSRSSSQVKADPRPRLDLEGNPKVDAIVERQAKDISGANIAGDSAEAGSTAVPTVGHSVAPDTKPSSVYDEDQLLPSHYFDFMYGTSTGGLIATMLGRLRMSVPQCMEVYREVGESLFGKKRSLLPLATKYRAKPLEKAVKDIVAKYCKQHVEPEGCNGQDLYPWELAYGYSEGKGPDWMKEKNLCQTICLTAAHNETISEPHLLRTYDHQYVNIPDWISAYNTGADPLPIWKVTRATSAAPFYFDALEADIRGKRWVFKDGGIRENNPAAIAWSEFVSMYGENKDPAILLSIGTGRPNEADNDGFADAWPGPWKYSGWMKRAAEKIAVLRNVLVKYTAGEETHKGMQGRARGENTWYKRLNVDNGLQDVRLDAWERGKWRNPIDGVETTIPGGATLTKMEQVTADYLDRKHDKRVDAYAPPRIKLQHAAQRLVRQRRARLAARALAPDKWDAHMGKYVTGSFIDQPDAPLVLSPS